ncbi:MAG: adenosine deaminase, partial [Thermoanaerobaculia bacterium]
MSEASLDRFIERMPKAELHLHLEGSIRPATLLRLASRHRVDLPATTVDGIRQWYRFGDFAEFVDVYLACLKSLRDPEDFQLVTDEVMADLERQNVVYCEAHLTVGIHAANGVNLDELADAMAEVIEAGRRRRGVTLRLITDIVRNLPEQADLTLEWALAERWRSVAALGLSGFESEPDEPFREHFAEAERQGLHRTAHAGENTDAANIRSALEHCRPERIGHGIRAVEDPPLMEELRSVGVPLEVCPSSNVALGSVPSLEEHPFDLLVGAGVEVTVNTDDPAYFDVTLSEEYRRIRRTWGYPAERLAGFSLAAVRHAFLEPGDR